MGLFTLRIRNFVFGLVMMLAVAAAVFLGAGLFLGPMAQPVLPVFGQSDKGVQPGAVLRKENVFICGDVEIVQQDQAPRDMFGNSLADLRKKYPESAGWTVEMPNNKSVVLRKKNDCFCGRHSLYRHFGIYNGKLAVYQGPLGYNQKLLRVEERKSIDSLPPDMKDKLLKAAEYGRLSSSEKASLSELEFSDENALNSYLENLDEITESSIN